MNGSYSNAVQGLIDIGLTEREAKVYLALLEKGSATAPLLQKISGVPQSKVYSTIDSLVRKGYFRERKAERTRIFEIIDPNVTLESSIQKIRRQLEVSIQLKEDLASIHANRENITKPSEYIEIVHGNDNIHHTYVELLRSAKFELLNFYRPPYAHYTEEMRHDQYQEYDAFVERAGKGRYIVEANLSSDPWVFENILKDLEKGFDFRVIDHLPLKMMIFDRETLLLADENPYMQDGELTMSVVKQSNMVKGYVVLFEFFWNQAHRPKGWLRNHKQLLDQKLALLEKSLLTR